ncbi:branched-chain amino acid ABC transporter ATP-binding protein/permease [Pseudonocardia sp. D17]|uniref:branched-chain amino acid ABC transporter ATP-binding protein/permease n=1 Tax=Pseudonocardia sp. D17 TaxID=882661 RepID=UPI002B376238|nr:metal-dependent hydrolase [Pseudonocardia sp. D17]
MSAPDTRQEAATRPGGRSPIALLRRLPGRDVLVALLAILVVLALSGSLTGYQAYVVTVVVIFTIIGASHTLLFGAAGQPSVGHAALLGAGVYAGIAVSRHTTFGMEGEFVAAIVVGALIGVVIGLPSLRIGSLYLAIATLALCIVAQQIFFEWTDLTGGGAGTQVSPPKLFGAVYTPLGLLYIALVVMGIALLFARNLLRGRQGRAWNAVRTSPLAASSLGISLGWQKVGAFGVSGAMVGCAGVLYAHAVNYVSPSDFSLELSIVTLVIAIIGGQRYLWGAALGAIFVEGLPEMLRTAGEFRYVIYGAVFVIVMIFFPEGFAGGIAALWRRFGPRRSAPPPGPVELEPTATLVEAELARSVAAEPAPAAAAERGGVGLTVRDVRVEFGGVTAVDGVTLDVAPGTVVGLVGPNGAGKTTLLNAVSGFVPVTGGEIRVGEHLLAPRRPAQRRALGVGRTFQNLSLHEGMTVLEHLLIGQHAVAGYGPVGQLFRMPAYVRGERLLRQNALETAELLGLADLVDERVENLAYGVQKRVDVARAVVARPRLLLLDEPAAGLTPDEGDDLVGRVLVHSRHVGATVVLVEHNIELVMRVADRVVALNFGRVIADDVPDVVRRQDDFVEAYLGG